MPPPNLVRHVFICASLAAVLIVAGLLASSYEGTTPTQPKGNETLLAARWMNMPFVGAAPHAASLRRRRRRSGKIFKTIQSSRNLADITGSSATNVTSPAKPTTAAVNTSSPLYRPTNVPSQHPSTAPSTVTPSEKPTASPIRAPFKSPITKNPTNSPSAHPNYHPSMKPTPIPSAQPTRPPTSKPSMDPTAPPSDYPTYHPSMKPTPIPSAQPTRPPTSKPSMNPTLPPIIKPSFMPSQAPTMPPSRQPTQRPSRRPTKKPTPLPSASPSSKPSQDPSIRPSQKPSMKSVQLPTNFPSKRPTRSPSASPAASPFTVTPTLEPTRRPTPYPTASEIILIPSYYPTQSPSLQPSLSYFVMTAQLSFNLPLSEPMTDIDIIASFETAVKDFIGGKLRETKDLMIEDYKVAVISQEVKDEPPRRRLLEDLDSNNLYLVVTTSLTARGSPTAKAEAFPFQSAAHSAITKSSDELFKNIYTSTLKQLERADETASVDISDALSARTSKNIAVGTSVGGAIALAFLVTLLFVQRGRERDAIATNEAPPATYANTSGKEEDVSSIDDSLVSANQVKLPYPENISHCNPDQFNRSIDQWSLDDKVADGKMPAKSMDDDYASRTSALKQVSFVVIDDEKSDRDKSSACTTNASQAKRVSSGDKPSSNDSSSSNQLREELLHPDSSPKFVHETSLSHALKSSPPFKIFSCFADNTYNEKPNTLTAKQILQAQYRSSTGTSKLSSANHGIYEVRAPPGALGLVIDADANGPFVYEVKATSPLNGQIETGDKIASIDGWCCQQRSAYDVANWIRKKPKKDVQVLVLKGKQWDEDAIEEESV